MQYTAVPHPLNGEQMSWTGVDWHHETAKQIRVQSIQAQPEFLILKWMNKAGEFADVLFRLTLLNLNSRWRFLSLC